MDLVDVAPICAILGRLSSPLHSGACQQEAMWCTRIASLLSLWVVVAQAADDDTKGPMITHKVSPHPNQRINLRGGAEALAQIVWTTCSEFSFRSAARRIPRAACLACFLAVVKQEFEKHVLGVCICTGASAPPRRCPSAH